MVIVPVCVCVWYISGVIEFLNYLFWWEQAKTKFSDYKFESRLKTSLVLTASCIDSIALEDVTNLYKNKNVFINLILKIFSP